MKANILLITADQWRGDCVSALGHPAVRTPALDALAAQGTLFARHYAGAAPCSPARASIYTGLYQMNHRVCRNGSPLDARFDTVALAARRAGYDPTLFGYTDTAPDPRGMPENDPHLTTYEGVLPGFTVRRLLPEHEKPWRSWLAARGTDLDPALPHGPADAPAGTIGAPPAYGADETQTAFLVDEFLTWEAEQDRPWFAHVSFLRPHPPFTVPEPYNSMFRPSDGPAPPRARSHAEEIAAHPFLAYEWPRQTKSSFMAGTTGRVSDWTAEDLAAIRAVYYGMIAEVDAQVGRLFETLKARGAWENTIVILTSDHAEMMGDHWALGKGGFFDGSYHIPLVIRDPARPGGAGQVVRRFTSAADLMPTVCERIGVAPQNHVDGASLLPFLEGENPPLWRDAAFFEYDFRDVETGQAEAYFGLESTLCNLSVIRDERFKYVHFAGLPPVLFDLERDPDELENCAEDPYYLKIRLAYAEKLLSLRARHLDQTLALTTLTEEGVVGRR
ncbi:alkaline phosphatase family protein [Rhizobiaceae bacterium BDR2-2]|uniref:Alkaline phosphatase family protein n=1 Tax=Ectorhizobium quercum TaxID=2965071 RepID=A0AAE3SSX8_9HYPH|nr:alkaline phosphatase family protein [Ectorhizobium quercum]MCX8995555.1 alkaline phosphatase family protein [Ectorhizobium quercum]